MADVTCFLFDVGGVLGTNGFDHDERAATAAKFGLDPGELEERNQKLAEPLESGRITLDAYLDQAVFHRPREFGREAFKAHLLSLSQPYQDTLAVAAELARTGRYLMATLNNESRELNAHRIAHFGLRRSFTLFLTSAYLGVTKPGPAIFRLALEVTQRRPDECLFVDDRAKNVEAARACGLGAIQHHDAAQLRSELAGQGLL